MKPVIALLSNHQQLSPGEFTEHSIVNQGYISALISAGGAPVGIPVTDDPEVIEELLGRVDGLLVTGGADLSPDLYGEQPRPNLGTIVPQRDRLDELAIRVASGRGLPILGICRGIQSLAVYAGGTLIQDIGSEVPGALMHSQKAPGWHGIHEIEIAEGSLLRRLTGRPKAMVNSFHHQAVKQLPEGWLATAQTVDGVIEAIEQPGETFCLGVQFHPEIMAARHDYAARIFEGFVEACRV